VTVDTVGVILYPIVAARGAALNANLNRRQPTT